MAVNLVVQRGAERVVRELKNGVYRVGREAPADIVIPDQTVSATHAELQVNGDVCTVRDLGSTNGTFLNGTPIRAATVVKPSDELRFGSVTVRLEPVQAAAPEPVAAPEGAMTRMAAVERAAGRLTWRSRMAIATAEALIFFLLLVIIVIFYDESGSTAERRLFRFRDFAAQYVHLLAPGTTSLPAPSLDESLGEPIMVLDRDGNVIYPQPTPGLPSPLADKKTNQIYDAAKGDLFRVPGLTATGGGTVYSYPVRKNGELVGFVIATPRDSAGSSAAMLILIVLIAGALSAIVLYFASRPVASLVRTEVDNLTSRVPAVAGGLTNELPRSTAMPELQPLAAEIERALTRQATQQAARQQAGGEKSRAYLDRLSDLVDTAAIAFCIVNSDYVLVHMNGELRRFREFAAAATGASLFAGGLSTVQARDLVQAMNAPSPEPFTIDLRRDGEIHRFAVFTRTFQSEGRRFYGLLFAPAG
jgi:hypothetical protein